MWRLKPLPWLVPWSLLGGLGLTLVLTFDAWHSSPLVTWQRLPGCTADVPRCIEMVRGYPARWLFAHDSNSWFSTVGLLRDWGQWALVTLVVLYLGWRLFTPGPSRRKLAIDAQTDLASGHPSGSNPRPAAKKIV